MSAITLLGTPAELYVSGTQYTALVLSYPLVMGATAYMFLPVFDRLQVISSSPLFLLLLPLLLLILPLFLLFQVTTSYEYLELRFGKSVRLLSAVCFTIQMVMYMAIVVYAPALALEQVTGFQLVSRGSRSHGVMESNYT